MKRITFILISLLLFSGCTLFNTGTSPTRAVETFLGKYQSLDKDVVNQLDTVVTDENFTSNQEKDYKELMKKQYKEMTYTIKDEVIDGDNAIVTTEIEVYDYGKAQVAVDTYLSSNENKFEDETGNFSNQKYVDYKIEELKKVNDRVKYTLNLKLTKVDNEWKLDNISDTERQKIHGVYMT